MPVTTAPALDLRTVRTPSGSTRSDVKRESAFGIPEAPTFRPTAEEFVDPLAYIASIRQEGERFGIIKIIPPDNWRPPFSLDTQTFWFTPRLQQVNSMEGSSRSTLNYIEQLQQFHDQQGVPLYELPRIEDKMVDFYQLKKEVAVREGYHTVTLKRQWQDIAKIMGFTKDSSSSAIALRTIYLKFILPYEIYLAKNSEEKRSSRLSSMKSRQSSLNTSRQTSASKKSSPLTDPGSLSDSTASEVSDDEHEIGRARRSLSSAAATRSRRESSRMSISIQHEKQHQVPASDPPGQELCEACLKGDNEDKMLLCDGCNKGYHLYCLKPPLQSIPESDWFCPDCLKFTGNDYGFLDGEERCLNQFQKICNDFKQNYFQDFMKKSSPTITEIDVEREFWHLAETPFHEVEVEYGADLHTSIHGSGFPVFEKCPAEPYSTCPWNLNNIPYVPDSLFKFIRNDISGMTTPWIYIGMVFSAFCWHVEDHNLYSINYMHWGDAKTWYGIPSSHANRFEDTMRQQFPDLFANNPDLLFHLTTMISPRILKEHHVDVYYLDQHPGEFVVTFPRSYHGGFNQGFNCAEAVNFAPLDWLPYGLMSVETYSDFKKTPVFSHDELIITMARQPDFEQYAAYLAEQLEQLHLRERICFAFLRQTYRLERVILDADSVEITDDTMLTRSKQNVVIKKRHHITYSSTAKKMMRQITSSQKSNDSDSSTSQLNFVEQCVFCKQFVYVSQLKCISCNSANISCLEHSDHLCDCEDPHLEYRVRVTVNEIGHMAAKCRAVADAPGIWHNQYMSLLRLSEKPTLKELTELLTMGEQVAVFHQDMVHERFKVEFTKFKDLKMAIQEANRWVEQVGTILKSDAQCPIQEAARLIEQAEAMGVQLPHYAEFRELYEKSLDYQRRCQELLAVDPDDMSPGSLEELEKEGKHMLFNVPEMLLIQGCMAGKTWASMVREFLVAHHIDPETFEQYVINQKQAPQQDTLIDDECIWTHPQINYDQVTALLVNAEKMITTGHIRARQTMFGLIQKWCELGRRWRLNAVQIAKQRALDLEEGLRVLHSAKGIPVDLSIYDQLCAKLKLIWDWRKRVKEAYGGVLTLSEDDVKGRRKSKSRRESSPSESSTETVDPNDRQSTADPLPTISVRKLHELLKEAEGLPLGRTAEVPMMKSELQKLEVWGSKAKRLLPRAASTKPFLDVLREFLQILSQMTRDKARYPESYCVCRGLSEGLMVNCEVCDEWYHAVCVGLTRAEAKQQEHYICGVCARAAGQEVSVVSPKVVSLETILDMKQQLVAMRFECEEVGLLNEVIQVWSAFKSYVDEQLQKLDQAYSLPDSIPTMATESIVFSPEHQTLVKSMLICCENIQIPMERQYARLVQLVSKCCPPPTVSSLPVPEESVQMSVEQPQPFEVKTPKNRIRKVKPQVYCLCQQPEDLKNPMIACDQCKEWYHFSCVNEEVALAATMEVYVCPICRGDVPKPDWFIERQQAGVGSVKSSSKKKDPAEIEAAAKKRQEERDARRAEKEAQKKLEREEKAKRLAVERFAKQEQKRREMEEKRKAVAEDDVDGDSKKKRVRRPPCEYIGDFSGSVYPPMGSSQPMYYGQWYPMPTSDGAQAVGASLGTVEPEISQPSSQVNSPHPSYAAQPPGYYYAMGPGGYWYGIPVSSGQPHGYASSALPATPQLPSVPVTPPPHDESESKPN